MPGEQSQPKHEHPWSELSQHRPHQLHQQTAHRAGEGVPLQQIPDEGETHRNRVRLAAERDPGENLVPEQEDEAEEEDEGGPDPDRSDGGWSGWVQWRFPEWWWFRTVGEW